MLEITSVKKNRAGVAVEWNNPFGSVSSFLIVFDDENSCTTIGLEPNATSFTAKNLSRYRTYDVYLKALTTDGWVTSNSYTYRLD